MSLVFLTRLSFFSLRTHLHLLCFFFFNDTATTEIYTLSLHDALPISAEQSVSICLVSLNIVKHLPKERSEEHTSELQSPLNLVCRLLLEKKKGEIGAHAGWRGPGPGDDGRTLLVC